MSCAEVKSTLRSSVDDQKVRYVGLANQLITITAQALSKKQEYCNREPEGICCQQSNDFYGECANASNDFENRYNQTLALFENYYGIIDCNNMYWSYPANDATRAMGMLVDLLDEMQSTIESAQTRLNEITQTCDVP